MIILCSYWTAYNIHSGLKLLNDKDGKGMKIWRNQKKAKKRCTQLNVDLFFWIMKRDTKNDAKTQRTKI